MDAKQTPDIFPFLWIDTWSMERKTVQTGLHGNAHVNLGGKEGMALLQTKEEEAQ